MGWQAEEFGSSHEGRAGAVLADGSEPEPVYFDGATMAGQYLSDWWVYNGKFGAPRATHLRGSCSCSWRGENLYPIDWAQVAESRYSADTSGPCDDWGRHISEVESRSVPLPAGLGDLLEQLNDQLADLAAEAPLAALKAVAALERTAADIGLMAADNVKADDLTWEEIGTGLGLTEKDARSRLSRYSFRR
ncbi:hypothetical protein ACFY2W_05420 [Streptomyces sp. NPDC001262]|uniref:hypothetical protein n=1 Tax=Streptomyces sp. NPDC001262 TaxID=3364552 RepID=UPI0036A6AE5C